MAFTVSHHPSAQKCSTKEKRSRLLISLGHKGSSVTYKWSDTCSKLKVKGKGEGRGGGEGYVKFHERNGCETLLFLELKVQGSKGSSSKTTVKKDISFQ